MLNWLKKYFKPTPAQVKNLLSKDWQSATLLSIDLELTGLDETKDEIISVGWQPISAGQLCINNGFYSLCQSDRDLAQSPSIHGITESQLQTGQQTQAVLQRLAPFGASHIWVFHNSQLDMSILSRYLKSYQLFNQAIVSIDTLELQRYLLNKHSDVIQSSSATLEASRHYFNLPSARAHHAYDDAFATAELLLAQLHQLSGGQTMALKDLQHTCAIKVWQPS